MTQSKPSGQSYQEILSQATARCLKRARAAYPEQKIADVTVRCDLRGTMAGQYRAGEKLIRYNLRIAERQFDVFLQRTVVHEVAHHVVEELWSQGKLRAGFLTATFKPLSRVRIKPHGFQWQEVMRTLGAADLSRCHNYSLQGIDVKRQKRYLYQCACRQHSVSTTRHKRILRGMQYLCSRCQQSLSKKSPDCVPL